DRARPATGPLARRARRRFPQTSRGSRRARLDAAARRSRRRRRRRAGACPPADRAAPGRSGARHPGGAPAQARPRAGPQRRNRVPAGAARGARAHPALRRAAPLRRRRARHRRARPLPRATDRSPGHARASPARARGRGRAASEPRAPARARRRVRARPATVEHPRSRQTPGDRRSRDPRRAGGRPAARARIGREPPGGHAADAARGGARKRGADRRGAGTGGRLGELRLDTDLDISHGVVRYLELLKLSALLQRPEGQSLAEALSDINARLLAATTPLQREIFQTSTLDETLLDFESGDRPRAQALVPREEHSLGPFLPRKGIGLALSASDIQTYRSCPLRYKFARVLRIPTEQTVHQRFGIVVHQVLERYHSENATTLAQMLELLEAVWRRSALGESQSELELLAKARAALTSYHARLGEQDSEPVWFERAFAFRLGPHHLRGRVDRVDRLADGSDAEFELIDYKTSRPKTAEQLADDVQLSLYALAAREAWQLDSSRQAYYYVLDDLKVPVPRTERDAEAVTEIVLEVGEGILGQEFEPTPSRAACSICDYRIVCPGAEG